MAKLLALVLLPATLSQACNADDALLEASNVPFSRTVVDAGQDARPAGESVMNPNPDQPQDPRVADQSIQAALAALPHRSPRGQLTYDIGRAQAIIRATIGSSVVSLDSDGLAHTQFSLLSTSLIKGYTTPSYFEIF
ncbi:MAG: hypothetical protein NT062_09395 [Proteobacteria bacterium]|nr:hypothetical protein [Pseudomonadota bacterium]